MSVFFSATDSSLLIDPYSWNHLSNACLANIHDDLLRAESAYDSVTACFQCESVVLS